MAGTTESGGTTPSRVGETGVILPLRARSAGGSLPPDPRTSRLSDRDLVASMSAGDEEAVGLLVERHGDMMFGLAYAILGERVDAEEACADAFVQAWRTAERFDPVRGSVAGWLAMMTRSRALDALRARKKRAEVAADVLETTAGNAAAGTPPETGPDRHAESAEARQLVVQAMAELPEAQRRVIELAYFGGLSQSEIADHLSVPLGTVKTRTLAAMKKLRDVLAPLLREEVA